MTQILSVGRAHPEYYYSQVEILEKIQNLWQSNPAECRKLEKFHQSTSVEGRYFALPIDEYQTLEGFGDSNNAFIRAGTEVAERAVQNALDLAQLEPDQVDAIFLVSVTGIAVPTIDARLVERVGLRPDIKRYPLFGLGCVAGAAGIARVNDYLAGNPDDVVLLVSVELCSLTFQSHDYSLPNLVGSSLFGDGCAAVLLAGRDRQVANPLHAGPRVLASKSRLYPDSQRMMGWDIGNNGFKIVLSAGVPEIVHEYLPEDVAGFLAEQQINREQVGSWVCHPGGPKVLDAFRDSLGLEEYDIAMTRTSLSQVGNMSSASVLYVMADTITQRRPAAGTYGLMMAMGPGFVSELVLLEW